jgi:hypothetical protein
MRMKMKRLPSIVGFGGRGSMPVGDVVRPLVSVVWLQSSFHCVSAVLRCALYFMGQLKMNTTFE